VSSLHAVRVINVRLTYSDSFVRLLHISEWQQVLSDGAKTRGILNQSFGRYWLN